MGEIFIGSHDREGIINEYIRNNDIEKVFVIGEDLNVEFENKEHIKFPDTIMYVYFYRLMQEINKRSLIVLNECLRKKNRYDLTYNCIRRYCLQTSNILIFNYFPIIEKQEDFMILYDMIQNNPFLKEPYKYMTTFENVKVCDCKLNLCVHKCEVGEDIVKQYEIEKEKIISQVNKDPDIIPRRLLKYSEKHKPKGYDSLKKIKPDMNIMVSNLKVDAYYYGEILKFEEELKSVLQRIYG